MSRSKTRKTIIKSSQNEESVLFLGLSLAGGKSDKSSLVVLEFFPKQNKIFLTKVFDRIKSDETISADLKIHELIQQFLDKAYGVFVDVPLTWPLCGECKLKCPGVERCKESHIQWMWNFYLAQKKKNKKLFTPYTQRCVEMYLQNALENKFDLQDALGANSAPLLARVDFIKKRLPLPFYEVSPEVSFWQFSQGLKLMKSQSQHHQSAVVGEERRQLFLKNLNDKKQVFIYHQDLKLITENSANFDAFLCGLTGVFEFKNLTLSKPKDFPQKEGWVIIPSQKW